MAVRGLSLGGVAGCVAAVLFLSTGAGAQVVTMCTLEETNVRDIERVLEVELGRAVRLHVLTPCESTDVSIDVNLGEEAQLPLRLELSLGDVAPAARSRFVAMAIAEMVRSGMVSKGAPLLATEINDSSEESSESPSDVPSEPGDELAAPPATPPPSEVSGAEEKHSALETEVESPSEFQLRFGLGLRYFLGISPVVEGPTTPVLGLAGVLQWRRLSLHLEAHGARFLTNFGTLWAWQVTLGVGFQLLSHETNLFELAWRVRGEFGVGLATGDPNDPAMTSISNSGADAVGAGLLDLSLLFHLGSGIDLGAIATAGIQQGFRVIDDKGFPVMSLHGLFAGLHLVLGFDL